jgi:hypothetical protein
MASKGRPAAGPKTPITIIFATSKNSNAQTKVKTIRNRSIDDLLDCNLLYLVYQQRLLSRKY